MSLRIRRIVFSLFALGFTVSAVGVLLYANGYRYDFGKHSLELTGSLHVESEPRGAEVYLEGGAELNFWRKTLQGEVPTTTARIKHLLPGSYMVRVVKDGYWEWIKDVVVEPGKTAFLSDVVLLKNDLPHRILETDSPVILF